MQTLVVDNSDPPDNQVTAVSLDFVNQQLWIALTSNNCDFSAFRPDGRDLQVFDSDGTTPLVTSLRNWKAGSIGLRFRSRFSVPAETSTLYGPYVHCYGIAVANLGYANPPHTVFGYSTQAGRPDGLQQGKLRCIDKLGNIIWTWESPNKDSINVFAFGDFDGDGVIDVILAGTSRIDRSVYALSLANPPATLWTYPLSSQGNTYIRALHTGNLNPAAGNEVLVSGSEGLDANSNGAAHGKIAILDKLGNVLATANQDPAVTNHTTQDAILADLDNSGTPSIFCAQAQHIYKYANGLGAPVWMYTHDGNRNYYSLAAGHLTSTSTRVVVAVAGVAFNDAYIGIMTVLDNSGAVLWEKPLAAHGYDVKCIDLDGDGWDEIVVATGTAAGGPAGNQFGPPYQGWGLITIYDRLGNEIFAASQPSPTKYLYYGNFDGTGRPQFQGSGDEGRFMRWDVDTGVTTATAKVIVPSVPWKQVRNLYFGSNGSAAIAPRGDRYFNFSGADGTAPIGMTAQIGVWTMQGGRISSPDDADTATAACLEAADVSAEAFEWEWTAYKPGQGTGTAGPYYNAARYRCTAWSGGRPDGYSWQHAQNGQIALLRTASGTSATTYTVTSTPINTVTFDTADKIVYRCVVFGDWHALYANKNDAGFLQLFNVQDTNPGKKSTAGSIAFLSQRGQTRIAASSLFTHHNSDGNSGKGPVPLLTSPDSNATVVPIPPVPGVGKRLLEGGDFRLLEGGAFMLLEGTATPPAVSDRRLLEGGAFRMIEGGAFRLLEGTATAPPAVPDRRLLEGGAFRLIEGGAFRLLESEGGVIIPPAQAGVGVADYVQTGDSIDYTPDADVDGGSIIVIGTSVGYVRRRITAGELGAMMLEGVISVDKPDGEVIAFGVKVYWDDTAQVATAVGPLPVVMGFCVKDALADAAKVLVKIVIR